MDIQHSDVGEVRKIVLLTGLLDTAGVDQVETKFGAAIVPARNTIVDLTQVSFMASMGIRMLIATARALSRKGSKLVMFGATPGAAGA